MTIVDYAKRDRAGEVAFYVLLWKRKGIELELFDNYWKDVHGPVCARLPGQYQYWQFHVGHNEGGIWPVPGDHLNASPSEQQFDGIAELTFKSEADRQTWFKAAGILMDDEYNIFSKAIGYNTSPGNSITYLDRIANGAPNGDLNVKKYHFLIRKIDNVSLEEFRQYLKERLAPIFANSEKVIKCRLHLFDEIDNSRPEAGVVSHTELPEQQYHAALEIAFANRLEMSLFLNSSNYQTAAKDLLKYVKHFKPFPERSAYTFVYEGKMTLAGQRSSAVANLITNIGAANQLKESIESLILGTGALEATQKTSATEKLPGTNSDLVKALFARGESFDPQGFSEFFTDKPVYQFGNYPICFDKESIKASTTNFFGAVAALYHNIKMLWEAGEVVFVEMDVTYWRKDGSVVTLPCMDIVRFEGNKVADLRIFMDANPVGDASIPVADTASLRIISEGKRLQTSDMMRKYFAEHPDGQARLATGFIPKWAIAGPQWSVKTPIPNLDGATLLRTPVNGTEKLPGTNSDLVKGLFARGESFDPQGFIEFFTDKPIYQFGNYPICFDKPSIETSTTNFFSMVSALYHDIKMLWEIGEVVFVEMDVTYWRKDGSVVTLPCMDIVRFEGNKIAELRICMDANPVGNANIPVADTVGVKFLSEKKRLQTSDVMRKYFAEHPDGQARVSAGFIPKWAIAGPKWPIAKPLTADSLLSTAENSELISQDKWEQVKIYLKTLVSDQLATLLASETGIPRIGN